MVSLLRLEVDPIDLQEEIKRRDDFAETIRRELFIAARRIQAWIRGMLTRKHFRLLHRSAISIQRHWRGYCARIFVDRYLVERVHQMWQDYYDRMATRIQATWRGYWVRKTVLDIPKMRRWLENVYKKNEETLENMNKFRQSEIEYRERAMERESMQWILFILFKLHHLLRTKQRPGVITRIDKLRVTFIEEMLKCFQYKEYTGRNVVCCRDCDIDPKRSLIFRDTRYERCEREIREIERDLRAGLVPVFRSFPYEDQEKLRREEIKGRKEASLHNQCEMTSPSTKIQQQTRRKTCQLKEQPNLKDPCAGINELYDQIRKMDCQLNQIRLKCPIHDTILSS